MSAAKQKKDVALVVSEDLAKACLGGSVGYILAHSFPADEGFGGRVWLVTFHDFVRPVVLGSVICHASILMPEGLFDDKSPDAEEYCANYLEIFKASGITRKRYEAFAAGGPVLAWRITRRQWLVRPVELTQCVDLSGWRYIDRRAVELAKPYESEA